jgi:protein arginine kinase
VPPLPTDVQRFARRVSSWLEPGGPESDVVLSCRVRLARNVGGYPFVPRLDAARAGELCSSMHASLERLALDGETIWVEMSGASLLLRLMLRERHLISRDLAPGEDGRPAPPGRAVAFGADERLSVMVNEEDHLRIQSLAPGFDLEAAFTRARDLDRALEREVEYSFTRELGYLTACPTNVGTGLRASVMLHLPGLSMVRTELEKVFAAAQRTGLAVRGLYGEGSRAVGDFYQISNQITLGRTEAMLIDDLRALVPVICDFERTVRKALLEDQRAALQDRISRSYGMLRTSLSLPTEGALAHLSNVRLGHHLGLQRGPSLKVLNELGVQVQRGHVQALTLPDATDGLIDPSERDRLRAGLLRQRMAEATG